MSLAEYSSGRGRIQGLNRSRLGNRFKLILPPSTQSITEYTEKS